MPSAIRTLMVALLPLATVTACVPGNTSAYVHSDSDQTWYIAVLRQQDDPGSLWVVTVHPGADGFAVSWDGGDGVPVAVLAPDCSQVGVFTHGDGDSWVVDGAPGLTARIENHGPGFARHGDEVVDTSDCGGALYH